MVRLEKKKLNGKNSNFPGDLILCYDDERKQKWKMIKIYINEKLEKYGW